MIRHLILILCVVLVGLNVGGCTRTIGEFSVLSTKPVTIPGGKEDVHLVGEDCLFIFIVPVPLGIDWTTATTRALETGKADLLYNVAFSKEMVTFFPFVGRYCLVVEGTGVQLGG